MKYTLLFLLATFISSCTKDKTQGILPAKIFVCDSTVTYIHAVKEIMDTKCALSGCHDAQTPGGGFNLTVYSTCKDLATTPILLCTIRHDTCGYKAMPYPIGTAKLSDSLIAIISCWITNGAPL